MLISQRVTSTDSAHFPAIDALYGRAFPWHEQREAKAKQQALDNPHYELEAWFDDGQFIGLSGCWRFADYRYVEHLAIDDTLRSRGYGKRLLAEILQRAPLTILEIDPLACTARVEPGVRNGELHEIKSPFILQPGPAALTDGLDTLHRLITAWAARHAAPSRA